MATLIPRRWLVFALLGSVLLGVIMHLPRLRARVEEWRLNRMSLNELEVETRRRPDDVSARYHLAAAYARNDEDDRAIPEYVNVLRKQPNHAKALNDLGAILMSKGKKDAALFSLRGAVQADPNNAGARANLGRLYLSMRNPYSATIELTLALQQDPGNAMILCDLGMAHQATMNFKSALDAYQRATRVAPENPDVWIGLGETYRGLAKVDAAKKALDRALKIQPKHAGALAALGRIVFEFAQSPDDLHQAERLLAQSLRLDSENVHVLYNLGVTRRKLGDDQGAISALKKAVEISPFHFSSLYQLGNAYLAVGRTQEGQFVLKRFNTLASLGRERTILETKQGDEPDNLSIRMRLSELYMLFQEPAAAAGALRYVLDRKPDDARAHRLFGVVMQALGNMDEARKHLQRAQEIDPTIRTPGNQSHEPSDTREIS